jgi:hypothetical protein
MLRISQTQMALMEAAKKGENEAWAVSYLQESHSDWCAQRSADEVTGFCLQTLAFAYRCRLYARDNLAILLNLRVTGRLPAPFSEWQKIALTREGFSEKHRFAQFMETLSGSHSRILISLQTDLNSLSL